MNENNEMKIRNQYFEVIDNILIDMTEDLKKFNLLKQWKSVIQALQYL